MLILTQEEKLNSMEDLSNKNLRIFMNKNSYEFKKAKNVQTVDLMFNSIKTFNLNSNRNLGKFLIKLKA